MTCKDCLHYPACAGMFKRMWDELPETGEGAERCDTFVDRSRYVVRERGEWITPTKVAGRTFNIPHCSACEGIPCGVDEYTNFCPCCGAEMRKREIG